jgi:oxygen-independent coproporphyrinogen-3 oxidase
VHKKQAVRSELKIRNFDPMSGIYIHIPFCSKKCSYCDFHFSTSFAGYRDRMIDSLQQELESRLADLKEDLPRTLYFGGGTPSLLTENELQKLCATVKRIKPLNELDEITLEANPEDITEIAIAGWKRCGINRLSIGIQSFNSEDLSWMNRAHTVEQSRNAVKLVQTNGFDNLTIDLMYGLPNMTILQWKEHIQEVLSWNVPHVSSYCLTIEKDTLLEKKIATGAIIQPQDDDAIQQFEVLIELMEEAGYEHYEISNFAKKGHRSKHNSAYWNGDSYCGIGPSAHSFDGTIRRWNVSNNALYMKRQDWFEEEVLTEKEQWNEYVLTRLRTAEGISLSFLKNQFELSEDFFSTKKKFIEANWLQENNEYLFLTQSGKLRADYIASEFFRV